MDEFVDELKKIQEEAKVTLCKAHDDMKCFADCMRWSTRRGIKCGLVQGLYTPPHVYMEST